MRILLFNIFFLFGSTLSAQYLTEGPSLEYTLNLIADQHLSLDHKKIVIDKLIESRGKSVSVTIKGPSEVRLEYFKDFKFFLFKMAFGEFGFATDFSVEEIGKQEIELTLKKKSNKKVGNSRDFDDFNNFLFTDGWKNINEVDKGLVYSLNQLSQFYRFHGLTDSALVIQRMAFNSLQIQRKEKSDLNTLASTLNNLGLILQDFGKIDSAIIIQEQSLEVTKEIYSQEHPYVAWSYKNLASLYGQSKQFDKAIAYQKIAIEILTELLGPKNSSLVKSYNYLGLLYRNIESYENAIFSFRKSLEIGRPTLDRTHPDYLTSLNNLAELYIEADLEGSADSLILDLGEFSTKSPFRIGKDYAVFFYVEDYENWPDLTKNSEEVNAIALELARNYGFEVEIIANPTKQEILNKVLELNTQSYGPRDQVLFFFSSHGHFDSRSDRGFLIPSDAKVEDPYGESWISYELLGQYINLNPSRHILLALDACYSGAFGDRFKDLPMTLPWEQEGECETQIDTTLAFSSRLYFTSGSTKHRTSARSLFANRWLTALKKGHENGVVRTNDLRYYLGNIEDPRPENGSFSGKHQVGGDFIFVHKNACGNNADTDLYEEHWQSIGDPPDLNKVADHLRLYPSSPHTNEAVAILLQGREEFDKAIPDNMVYVKGGSFQMGSKDGDDDEEPIHKVTLSDYYLGKYETTNSEFATFLNEFGNQKMGGVEIYKLESSSAQIEKVNGQFQPKAGMEDHPVLEVSWHGAVAYCNWRSDTDGSQRVYTIESDQVAVNWQANGYRLPTEAEWEYAARRGGGNNIWAGTSTESQLNQFGNFSGDNDGYENTAPVGSFKANALGLHDMSGNVWEWCWDWKADYSPSAQTNPHGPTSGSNRVFRGGSWRNEPVYLRCANRNNGPPGYRNDKIGFRLSRSVH